MTEEAFIQLCEHLSDHLWLQGLLVAAGTCFLEDAARCGVSLLVAAGHVGWWLAFFSMIGGGMAGDVALYLIGRYATLFMLRRRWMDAARLESVEEYFKSHAVKTILISRLVPGARTFAYSAAGVIRYPLPRFLFLLFGASVVQAVVFLQLGAFIGDKILPYLRDTPTRLGLIAVIFLAGALLHHVVTRRRKQKAATACGKAVE